MAGFPDLPDFAADDDGEDGPHERLFSHDHDGETEDVGGARAVSMEELRDHALRFFGETMRWRSGKGIPMPPPEETHTYLTLEELQSIVREHGRRADGGTVIGGDTREEAQQKLQELLSAIQSRILSNILREAVRRGMLACDFDPETNDFSFSVTDEGRERFCKEEEEDDDEPVDP